MKNGMDNYSDIKILMAVKAKVNESAKFNSCPACKHDTIQLSKFLSKKIISIRTGKAITRDEIKILKNLDYLDVMQGVARNTTKLFNPISRTMTLPDYAKDFLKKTQRQNQKARNPLIDAKKLMGRLKYRDNQLDLVSEIIDDFIKALDFKLSVDDYTFYLLQKIIKFSYRTHLLTAIGKIIVFFKELSNPSRYK